MLYMHKHIDTFCSMLLESNLIIVSPHVPILWCIAGIKACVEFALGHIILQKCTWIIHLNCNINFLTALMCYSGVFMHHDLKELTPIEPKVPWKLLFNSPAGHQFFKQVTHHGGT
jgi:hypothetical protein